MARVMSSKNMTYDKRFKPDDMLLNDEDTLSYLFGQPVLPWTDNIDTLDEIITHKQLGPYNSKAIFQRRVLHSDVMTQREVQLEDLEEDVSEDIDEGDISEESEEPIETRGEEQRRKEILERERLEKERDLSEKRKGKQREDTPKTKQTAAALSIPKPVTKQIPIIPTLSKTTTVPKLVPISEAKPTVSTIAVPKPVLEKAPVVEAPKPAPKKAPAPVSTIAVPKPAPKKALVVATPIPTATKKPSLKQKVVAAMSKPLKKKTKAPSEPKRKKEKVPVKTKPATTPSAALRDVVIATSKRSPVPIYPQITLPTLTRQLVPQKDSDKAMIPILLTQGKFVPTSERGDASQSERERILDILRQFDPKRLGVNKPCKKDPCYNYVNYIQPRARLLGIPTAARRKADVVEDIKKLAANMNAW